MESENRHVWIILALILVGLCCCTLALAAAGAGWFVTQPSGLTGLQSERSEQDFFTGDAPSLKIDNFAGNVIFRTGPSGAIRVASTRKARNKDDLDRIEVVVSERAGGLLIKTKAPSSLNTAAVDLEITTPASTSVDAFTGAGNVNVDGVTGKIDIHSGAGNLDVRGASGCARLDTGAGNVRYHGTPLGQCHFETGAGNITLALPAGLNAQVDLETRTGQIEADFAVGGHATRRVVQGVIGSGDQGSIYAHTGAGNIHLVQP